MVTDVGFGWRSPLDADHRRAAILVKTFLLATTCSLLWLGGTMADPSARAAAEAAIGAAIDTQQAAVGGEWRDTGKLIDKAKQAVATGDYNAAQLLAQKAETQGKLGEAQARNQIGAGSPAYLYD